MAACRIWSNCSGWSWLGLGFGFGFGLGLGVVLEAAREAVAREQEGVDVGDRHHVRRAAGVVQQPWLGLGLGLALGFGLGLG